MSIDVGKSAKTKGSTRPRDARRADPAPPRATSKARKKSKAQGQFGISYESKELAYGEGGRIEFKWLGRIRVYWYESRAQRDQALKSFQHRYKDSNFYRDHQAVDRVSGSAGGSRGSD